MKAEEKDISLTREGLSAAGGRKISSENKDFNHCRGPEVFEDDDSMGLRFLCFTV